MYEKLHLFAQAFFHMTYHENVRAFHTFLVYLVSTLGPPWLGPENIFKTRASGWVKSVTFGLLLEVVHSNIRSIVPPKLMKLCFGAGDESIIAL